NTTLGRPDVTISVLDSGIKWNDAGAMHDLRLKVRINKGELPTPNHNRGSPVDPSLMAPAQTCADFSSAYDANGDGVFNVADYNCDTRVNATDSHRHGPAAMLTPEDLIIAFSDGTDGDHNGYVDDIAG